jgi:tetratricopeptide (TPR) repeat protein
MAGETTKFDRVANWFDGLRKAAVAVAVVVAGVVAAAAIIREMAMGGIVIDPVAVKASDRPDAPTPELAAQQIARQLDRIQKAGVKEWRKAHVDDGIHPVDLQIPGSPLSLRSAAREVVALFGMAPVTLRSAIGRRLQPAGYAAVMSLVGDHGSSATCEAEDSPHALDDIFECIALNAMSFTDPKVAASYMFQRERAECKGLDTDIARDMPELQREEHWIENRRDRCSFTRTQKLIAKVLDAGNKNDLPWVPYIFGQVHLARAEALAGVGLQEQLSELDQAIGRFLDSKNRMPDSSTAVAILLHAYLTKGVAIHQSTSRMDWDDDPKSPMQARLKLAELTFADAESQLRQIPAMRSARFDALVNRLEGLLLYRRWMIAAHRRTKSTVLTMAIGYPAELALLAQATAKFESAQAKETVPASSLMEWGNILRAEGRYEDAIEKYRRAADLDPTNSNASLNIAVAYIDRVGFGPKPAEAGHLLIALGALSDYLAWMSAGGPYDHLLINVKEILARSGDAGDQPAFQACLDKALAVNGVSDPKIDHWKAAAAFKFCVDEVIERVSGRAMRTADSR